ncbi:MAG: hypothetical protein AB1538_13100 [Bacillota bacterium]
MAIQLFFTPHDEAERIFSQAREDILIITPNIKEGFMNFIDKIASAKNIIPRLIINLYSEAGTKWDRSKAFSDYPQLIQYLEKSKWQARVAKFSLRAYCIDRRIVIISTVNPGDNGRLTPGGIWIVFNDTVSSTPFVNRFEYFWSEAKDLKVSEVAGVLEQKGQDIGEFLDHPPDQQLSYHLILQEEAALEESRKDFEVSPSEHSLMKYLKALEPFDYDGSERSKVAGRFQTKHGESATVLSYLARLNFEKSNLEEANRNALLALGKDQKKMDMVAIIIAITANSDLNSAVNFSKGFEPNSIYDFSLLNAVAGVLGRYLENEKDEKVASNLLKVYRCIYELNNKVNERPLYKKKASELAQRYGWKLGW